jgi:hypothetical protein
VVVAAVVLLAGCAGGFGSAPAATPTPTATDPTDGNEPVTSTADGSATGGSTTESATSTSEPPDRLGVEGGAQYDEQLAVTPGDGLNRTELAAVVNRTMARVEVIRGLEFTRTVPVEVISRAEYRNRSVFDRDRPPAVRQFREQVWEATFVVGEDESVDEAFGEVFGSRVVGYYSPGKDRIVIVSDEPTPKLDRATLAHELVHALQDQHFSLGGGARSRDEAVARDGLVEGDARYVEVLYERRCAGNWSCIPRPDGPGGGSVDQALFTAIFQPYSEGAGFVATLRDRNGWAAVNAAYDDFPASTEQVIHPAKYPDEEPVEVSVPDRSTRQWSPIPARAKSERLGELGVYTALWATRTLNREDHFRTDPLTPRNYSHPVSAGWGGDSFVPYRDGDGGFGYVWKIQWDTRGDAETFVRAYRRLLLLGIDAARRGAGQDVFAADEGPFADAYRIERRGKTVVITNAPTVAELDEIRDRQFGG